jgi:hypothetical protein
MSSSFAALRFHQLYRLVIVGHESKSCKSRTGFAVVSFPLRGERDE